MSVVDDIKARLDIVDVVSGYIPLQRAGRNFKARCPFHAEKTPSFVVNTERQSWHCFGACSTGGDAFSFVMRQEKLDFGEALRTLAQKTGVELGQRGERDRGDVLFRVNQEAARFYQETLRAQEGRVALDYLTERGVDYKTASDFQLGASPRGRDGLKSHLTSLGFEIEDAVKAGLLRRNEDGTIRDFFWGRLMFPIHDRRGRVTGFGGRSLDGSDPKYINTAATSVFDKRTILYGLHRAIDAIREQDTAIIVEGYMDVIAAHQFSHANVVASMGTALTERQVGLIRSAAGTFVLALDPDTAGQEATLRSLESAWQAMDRVQVAQSRRSVGALYQTQRLDLRIAALPAGLDPDKLIREDAAEWARIVGDAVPYMDFYIPAKARQFDLATTQGKSDAAEAILSGVTSTINPFEQERLFRMLAQRPLATNAGDRRPTARRGRTRPVAADWGPPGHPGGVHSRDGRRPNGAVGARHPPRPRLFPQNRESRGVYLPSGLFYNRRAPGKAGRQPEGSSGLPRANRPGAHRPTVRPGCPGAVGAPPRTATPTGNPGRSAGLGRRKPPTLQRPGGADHRRQRPAERAFFQVTRGLGPECGARERSTH